MTSIDRSKRRGLPRAATQRGYHRDPSLPMSPPTATALAPVAGIEAIGGGR